MLQRLLNSKVSLGDTERIVVMKINANEFYKDIKKYEEINQNEDLLVEMNYSSNEMSKMFQKSEFYTYLLYNFYKFNPIVLYNENILFSRRIRMDKKIYYFNIAYNRRSEYIDIVYQVNLMVSVDGLCSLYVNNIPTHLSSILVIADKPENISKIKDFLLSKGITLYEDKTFYDLMMECACRNWNSISFVPQEKKEKIQSIFHDFFQWPEDEDLKKNGYDFNPPYQPKIFFSYSWKNKDVVDMFAEQLQSMGLNIWIDRKDIEGGEHIHEAIMRGIEECDMAILFISEAYKNSVNAVTELKTIFSNIVCKKKWWRIYKLDDVNPNDVFPSLDQYKYYTVSEKQEIFDSVLRGIEEIINNHKNK